MESKSKEIIHVNALYSPECEPKGSILEKIRNKYIVEYGRDSYNTGLGQMRMVQAGNIIYVNGNKFMFDRIRHQFFSSKFLEFTFKLSKET